MLIKKGSPSNLNILLLQRLKSKTRCIFSNVQCYISDNSIHRDFQNNIPKEEILKNKLIPKDICPHEIPRFGSISRKLKAINLEHY